MSSRSVGTEEDSQPEINVETRLGIRTSDSGFETESGSLVLRYPTMESKSANRVGIPMSEDLPSIWMLSPLIKIEPTVPSECGLRRGVSMIWLKTLQNSKTLLLRRSNRSSELTTESISTDEEPMAVQLGIVFCGSSAYAELHVLWILSKPQRPYAIKCPSIV